MRIFKITDLLLQLLLITGSLVYAFAAGNLMVPYLVVGGYQLLSCLIHSFLDGHYYPSGQRKKYLMTLFWLLVVAIVTVPIWIYFGLALLLVSPGLAIWYLHISYTELETLRKAAFIHLK